MKNKNKILKEAGVLLIAAFLIASTVAVAANTYEKKVTNEKNRPNCQEVIDQQQIEDDGSGYGFYQTNIWYAQGFTPSLEILTKIEIFLFKVGNPPAGVEATLSIRDNLQGGDITLITKDITDVVEEWVEFDLEDIEVNPGEIYYLVVRMSGGAPYNQYCWVFSESDVYLGGDAWVSSNSGSTWTDPLDPNSDMTFITYGLDYSPNSPSINGPISGQIGEEYTFNISTEDPEGHQIYYHVKWGDGQYENWIGPYNSSEEVNMTHTWNTGGTYDIEVKAKDVYNVQSNLSIHTINIEGPSLNIDSIEGGKGITVTIKNVGEGVATNLEWNIKVTGGFLGMVDADVDGNKSSLAVNTTEDAASGSLGFFHLGPLEIEVTADADNAAKVTEKATAFIIGPIVIGIKEA